MRVSFLLHIKREARNRSGKVGWGCCGVTTKRFRSLECTRRSTAMCESHFAVGACEYGCLQLGSRACVLVRTCMSNTCARVCTGVFGEEKSHLLSRACVHVCVHPFVIIVRKCTMELICGVDSPLVCLLAELRPQGLRIVSLQRICQYTHSCVRHKQIREGKYRTDRERRKGEADETSKTSLKRVKIEPKNHRAAACRVDLVSMRIFKSSSRGHAMNT